MSSNANKRSLAEELASIVEPDRYERRNRPSDRAFEGSARGGRARYSQEQIQYFQEHGDEIIAAMKEALKMKAPDTQVEPESRKKTPAQESH